MSSTNLERSRLYELLPAQRRCSIFSAEGTMSRVGERPRPSHGSARTPTSRCASRSLLAAHASSSGRGLSHLRVRQAAHRTGVVLFISQQHEEFGASLALGPLGFSFFGKNGTVFLSNDPKDLAHT